MKIILSVLRINITIYKSLENHERNLLEEKNDLKDENSYKEYLTFLLNNFSIAIDLREDFHTAVSFKIFNFFLMDNDFNLMINEEGEIYENKILHSEFSVINQ
jgi:hypothetical protein